MSVGRDVMITLTDGQVAQILRDSAGRADLEALISGRTDVRESRDTVLALMEDEAYSRSLLRGMLVLAAFPRDGGERRVTEVARELGLSAGTAHRCVHTFTALGLLEQDPRSRRYRRRRAART
jgi:IclR helix-turn-helix domain